MIKRLSAALAAVFVATSAYAAGTIPFSLSQQLDNFGKPLAGCQLYTIVAGTTSTPQNAFQDSALTLPLPNPQTCDAAGRLPQMFLADGTIKVRLTNSVGVTVVVADNIAVIGASSGGGGGGSVDPTTILTTGDIKATYGTGVVAGFVRLNGRTIGSATSGATERANLDTQALFTFLWNGDPNLVVSTGRGVSAAADWAANKQITLPDWRGRLLGALDDMGSTAAGRLTSTFFGTAATVLGAAGGTQSRSLSSANVPSYTPSGTITVPTNTFVYSSGSISTSSAGTTANPGIGTFVTPGSLGLQNLSGGFTTFIGNNNGGTSTAFGTLPPAMLATFYLKL